MPSILEDHARYNEEDTISKENNFSFERQASNQLDMQPKADHFINISEYE